MRFVPNTIGRVAIAAGAVLVLGGSAVGIAAAQTTPTATPTAQQQGYQKFIGALAQRLGISTQQLQSDISQARQDAGLPANGGFGAGRGGRGGPGGPGRAGFRPFVNLQVAAQAIGISQQQLQSELPGKSLAQVATNHNKQASDVVNALTTDADNRIDQAVSSGRLTADQGNTQKTNAANRINQQVNQVTPQGGPGGNGQPGPGGPGRGRGGPGGRGFGLGIVQQGLTVAAQAIGITPQQLQSELPGNSLATVATNHGKQASDVEAALTTAANQRIDQAVSGGRLTADQGNTQKTNVATRINQLVNMTWPQRGQGGQGGQQQGQPGA
jgi:hypothetical protein